MKKPSLKQLMKRPALWIDEEDNYRISMPTANTDIFGNGCSYHEYLDYWMSGAFSLKELKEKYDFVGWL
ncbi:MAG: hypothetical protein IPQ08_06285 [Chitinophagaceae bacterium]|nr:hypothetical protein [Chitinophagaceae bacterium]